MSTERNRVQRDDTAVSAVIGVILMVAITVAIAATVYIWAGGFGTGDSDDEAASATAKAISVDSTRDWIRVTLASGDTAPYAATDVSVEVLDSGDAVRSKVCDDPNQAGSYPTCANEFTGSDTWDTGESKFIPCAGSGSHQVTLAVLGSTVMDRTVNCANAAATS